MSNVSTMSFGSVHNLLLSVQGKDEPGEHEWRRFHAELERSCDQLCGIVVVQRARLPALFRWRQLMRCFAGRRRLRIAFLTGSSWQRATIGAISWLADWDAAAFESRDLHGALDYVLQGGAQLVHDDVAHELGALERTLLTPARTLH